MFAPKDMSSLQMLSSNLSQAVIGQNKNALFAANVEREVARRGMVESAISGLSSALQDPQGNIGKRNMARQSTIALLARAGAIDEANAIEKTMEKPEELQYVSGTEHQAPGTFNKTSGKFTQTDPNWKPKAEVTKQYTGRTKVVDGIIHREWAPADKKTLQFVEGGIPQYEPWAQERDDSWFERFRASLTAKDLNEVANRVEELKGKMRDYELKLKQMEELEQSPSAGIVGENVSEEEIAAQKERITASKKGVMEALGPVYDELTSIEKEFGGTMVTSPRSEANRRSAMPNSASVTSTTAGRGTAKPQQNADGQFTVADIRKAYPQAVAGKTDQQIIDAYKKQNITIVP